MNLFLFVVICCFVCVTNAVERSKFRTCDQTAYCKRNRALAENQNSFSFLAGTARVDTAENLRLPISMQTKDVKKPPPLFADFEVLRANILRFALTEKNPNRYQGPREESLIDGAEVAQPKIFNRASFTPSENTPHPFGDSKSPVESFEYDVYTVFIQRNPFQVKIVESKDYSKVLIHINNKNMLNFEYYRSKEDDSVATEIVDPDATKPETWDEEMDGEWTAPMIPNPAAEGRWSEQFGSYTDEKKYGPSSVGADVSFGNAVHLYGIPEHATSLSLKPTRGTENDSDPYRLYNLDVFEYELDNPMALYGSVPLMLAHSKDRTTGFLWLNSAETWIDVHADKSTHWFSESGQIDIYVLPGPTPFDVMRQYAALTGSTPLPPMWSLGYHQCKWNYKTQAEVKEVNEGFDAASMPMDVIWLDIEHTDGKRYFTWDKNHFPDPSAMLEEVAKTGRRMVTIVDPHIKRDTNYAVHTLAESAKVYVKKNDGNDFDGHCWPGPSSWVDYTSPVARQWWAERFQYDNYPHSSQRLYIWNDMNEPSVFSGPEVTMDKNALHANNVEHRDVHNLYAQVMHRATWEGLILRDVNEELRPRPFLLTRGFFVGSQRYGAVWTGDNKADWGHLKASTPMLLSLSIAGIQFSGADVGGFFGDAGSELLTRWYQTAIYQPFFREHGHLDTRRKEPFLQVGSYRTAIGDALRIRYRMLPYWYTLFEQAYRTGVPPMRPLFMQFPNESGLAANEQQFMLGDAILVVPVVEEGIEKVQVELPYDRPGAVWYSRQTGSALQPGQKFEQVVRGKNKFLPAPTFLRGGSIIAERWRPRRSVDAMMNDPYTIIVALNRNSLARGNLYVDDGISLPLDNNGNVLKPHWSEHDRLYSPLPNGFRQTMKFKKDENRGLFTSTAAGSDDTVTNEHRSKDKSGPLAAAIERIIIHGLDVKRVEKATLHHLGKSTEIEFGEERFSKFVQKKVFALRRLNVPAIDDFSIELTWSK